MDHCSVGTGHDDEPVLLCRHHAKIVKRHGAAVVVMAFDEEGQAATAADKARADSHTSDRLHMQSASCSTFCNARLGAAGTCSVHTRVHARVHIRN